MSEKITLLVLAAGMGSRYGGLKQLDHIGPAGETIMDYSVYDAINAGFDKIVFVIRQSFEQQFREQFVNQLNDRVEVEVAYQEIDNIPAHITRHPDRQKPWGTAHAVWCARDCIDEPFAMINADDFYGREAFDAMARFLKGKYPASDNVYGMCGYRLENTLSEHGSVSRGVCSIEDGYLQNVEEHTHITIDGEGVIKSREKDPVMVMVPTTPVSMNFWGFTPGIFTFLDVKLQQFLAEKSNDLKAEVYIPVVVDELIKEKLVAVQVLECQARWFGITHRADKQLAVDNINQLVKNSVYPAELWS